MIHHESIDRTEIQGDKEEDEECHHQEHIKYSFHRFLYYAVILPYFGGGSK